MGEISGEAKGAPILLYLHIPKAGGTTLSSCIRDQLGTAEQTRSEEHPDKPGRCLFHYGIYYYPGGYSENPEPRIAPYLRRALARKDLRAVTGHFWFGIHKYIPGRWAYTTILRDPVERTVSLYSRMAEQTSAHNAPYAGASLENFVRNPPPRAADNDQTRRIAGGEPEPGQCTRAMLDRAKDNLRRHFQVVGVTERFDETLMLLKHEFGWTKSLRYYPGNQTRKRLATSSLGADSMDTIRARNEMDLELHQFAHVLLDEAVEARGPAFRGELASFQESQKKWVTEVAQRQAELTPEPELETPQVLERAPER